MKRISKITVAVFAILAAAACRENKNHRDTHVNSPEVRKELAGDSAQPVFNDGVAGKTWHNYRKLKMALVGSDEEGAKSAASDLAEGLGEEHAGMYALARELAGAGNLEEQRELFSALSEKAGPVFRDDLAEGTIYKKYCPMAFGNKGAYWYSDVPEIQNPYFGEKMLSCGSVKETISRD